MRLLLPIAGCPSISSGGRVYPDLRPGSIAYETSTIVADRIRKGELAILTPSLIDALAKQGRLAPGSNVPLARSGVGIAIRVRDCVVIDITK